MPDRFFVGALLRRTVWLWVGVRGIVALFGTLAGMPVFPRASRDIIVIVLVVATVAALELQRRREFLVFANLGIAPSALVTSGVFAALLLELALATIAAVLG